MEPDAQQGPGAGAGAAMVAEAIAMLKVAPPPGHHVNDFAQANAVANALRTCPDPRPMELVRLASEAGDTRALLIGAILYERSDPQQARRLAWQAAEQGDTGAMVYLGLLLDREDHEAAKSWFARADGAGDSEGTFLLGMALKAEDTAAAKELIAKAAKAGNIRAVKEVALISFCDGDPELAEKLLPPRDPRATGLLPKQTPVTRGRRAVAECTKCRTQTIQDEFEIILGPWVGFRVLTAPTTAGKTGRRYHFASCTMCGCLFPLDDAARQYAKSNGADYFNPAKLRRS